MESDDKKGNDLKKNTPKGTLQNSDAVISSGLTGMLEALKSSILKQDINLIIKSFDNVKTKTSNQGNRTTILRNLRNNFKEENLVLVLGAGISLDYKIPTWNELLRHLLARALEDSNENQQMVATYSIAYLVRTL